MKIEIQESAGNSDFPMPIDSNKALLSQKVPMTAKILGIEIDKEAPFTKQDFEDTLKRVSHPKKQSLHGEGKLEK